MVTAQVSQYGIGLDQHQVSILDLWQLAKNLQDVGFELTTDAKYILESRNCKL